MHVAFKECHITPLCVQRYLVILDALRNTCDGFLHGNVGDQLVRAAAEPQDGTFKHHDFDVAWYNGQLVDLRHEKQQ